MPRGLPPQGENVKQEAASVGLPPRPFLYTLDQICLLIDVNLATLKQHYIFFEGRSTGVPSKDLLVARNIAPKTTAPDWRVAERELIRWMRRKGFRYYERASIRG